MAKYLAKENWKSLSIAKDKSKDFNTRLPDRTILLIDPVLFPLPGTRLKE
jgi:hypothetical protein